MIKPKDLISALILSLLIDHSICHGMPVTPALRAPHSGCGGDSHSMADTL